MALIVAGVSTMIQAFPVGPVGARLPVVMGTSFAFLGPLIGIGNQFGIAAVFGAALVAAPVEMVMGVSLDRFRHYFPPLVTGGFTALLLNVLVPGGGVGTGPTEYSDGLASETPTDMEETIPEEAATTED